jgi:hypothetical protein
MRAHKEHNQPDQNAHDSYSSAHGRRCYGAAGGGTSVEVRLDVAAQFPSNVGMKQSGT